MNTAHRITNELNRQPSTIAELAKTLGISRNSAHVQISRLEAGGLVQKCPEKKSDGAGKPASLYRATPGQEDAFSDAHRPVLSALMSVLSEQLGAKKRREVLERTGALLAQSARLKPTGQPEFDVKQSIEVVNELGAMADLRWEDDCGVISCHSCPVAAMVHEEPLTCDMVAAFFSEASGLRVQVDCRRNGAVVCGFRVLPASKDSHDDKATGSDNP